MWNRKRRPSPFDHGIGIPYQNFGATYGFTFVTTCPVTGIARVSENRRFGLPLTPLSSYRGAQAISRTGLQPVGRMTIAAYGSDHDIFLSERELGRFQALK